MLLGISIDLLEAAIEEIEVELKAERDRLHAIRLDKRASQDRAVSIERMAEMGLAEQREVLCLLQVRATLLDQSTTPALRIEATLPGGGELFGTTEPHPNGDSFHDGAHGQTRDLEHAARKGVARMCAHRLPHTDNVQVGAKTLTRLVADGDEEVRKQVSEVAGALRGHALRSFDRVLKTLMASPAFTDALPQLLITLERAPDRIDDLILLCVRRFVEVFGTDASDIRTGAAGDAREVGELIIRGLAQSRSPAERSELLDVLDGLLMVGAHGVEELINASER